MAWPFDMGLRTASLRLLGAKTSCATDAKNFAVNLRMGRLRQVLAVGNLALGAAIFIGYAHATFGVQAALPGVGELAVASAGYPIVILVVSSAIASLALLGSNGRDTQSSRQMAVTEPVEAEHSDTRNISRQEESDAEMAGLLSSMGHDLRTPLNAIIGFSDMMQQEMHGPLGSDRYQSYATHIRDSGLALLSAIETTLALTERLRDSEHLTSVAGATHADGSPRG